MRLCSVDVDPQRDRQQRPRLLVVGQKHVVVPRVGGDELGRHVLVLAARGGRADRHGRERARRDGRRLARDVGGLRFERVPGHGLRFEPFDLADHGDRRKQPFGFVAVERPVGQG